MKATGTLDITDGAWSGLSGSATYSVAPGIELAAAEGSEYVEPGTEIVTGENTFILIPQALGADASVTLEIEQNGNQSTFTASLDGQTWTAGTTVTYRLSANPSSQQLILQITDESANASRRFLPPIRAVLFPSRLSAVMPTATRPPRLRGKPSSSTPRATFAPRLPTGSSASRLRATEMPTERWSPIPPSRFSNR